jgi:hypothetical protein
MRAIGMPTGRERSSTPDSHVVVEATLSNDSIVAWRPQATLARDIPRVMGMTQTVSPSPEPAVIRIACRVANCNLRSP